MKRLIICLLVFVFTQYAFASDLSSVEDFNQYKDAVVESVKDVSTYKAADAYKEIKKNLEKFQLLYQKIQETEYVDDIIDEVANGLDAIARSYVKISSIKESVLDYRQNGMSKLTDIEGKTLKTIETLNQEMQKLNQENVTLQTELESVEDGTEKRKIQVSLKANESIIKSLNAQILIWEKFYDAQKRLITKLDLNTDQIDLLMHILEKNALVYKEASNVVKLRRSAVAALKNLSALSDMQGILSELETSWYDVDILVTQISEVDFKLDLGEE